MDRIPKTQEQCRIKVCNFVTLVSYHDVITVNHFLVLAIDNDDDLGSRFSLRRI